jgi:hypothetical protein
MPSLVLSNDIAGFGIGQDSFVAGSDSSQNDLAVLVNRCQTNPFPSSRSLGHLGVEGLIDGGPVGRLVAPVGVRHPRSPVGIDPHGVNERRRHRQRTDRVPGLDE